MADPQSITLNRPGEKFTILVHGKTASGQTIDLTHEASYVVPTPSTNILQVTPRGVVSAQHDGSSKVIVRARGMEQPVNVAVSDSQVARTFHFETNIGPLFSRYGCNTSGCHGKAEGQNGFKLSVFGYDARSDYEAVTHAARGRRLAPATPEHSLLLLKATGQLPHGGGERIAVGSHAYETLLEWIVSGAGFGEEADHAKVVSLE
ncbi:MAG: hypothetical protein ACKVHP_18325, partial [Verrucomicrobiales bacterium]